MRRSAASDVGWSHIAHHHPLLLRAVPRPCGRALEIGCGEGAFARRLAALAERVDAIDRDVEVVHRARAASAGIANLHVVVADFMTTPIEESRYDFVCCLAALHHLPCRAALLKMRAALRPGGVLGVIGLYRDSTLVDALHGALALPVSWAYRLTHARARMNAPMREPELSLSELRVEAARLLPGAVVTRRLFWRYSLLWTRSS